jgi:phosphohistidine swiveling domain-containing protein
MTGSLLGKGQPEDTGAKAYHLDLALRKGLAVPPGIGFALTDLSEQTLIEVVAEVSNHLGDGPFAVRSSFRGEDSATQSQAGRYESVLFVETEQLSQALSVVFNSAGAEHSGPRGVVVQQMVDARHAGVLFSQPDFLDPLVSWTEGTAEGLVGGEESGITEELGPNCEGYRQRVRTLADQVRKQFEPVPLGWDVEWADDGSRTWLVQARPITAPPLRDELFSYANIREIMPDPPSIFMSSIVERAGLTLYEYYRNFDPGLPKDRPLIELQMGRPLFNISLLCETMRHWGLPTALVTDQIGGHDVTGVGFKPATFLSKWKPIAKQAWAQFQAVGNTRKAIEEVRRMQPAGTLGELADQVGHIFQYLVTVMLDLTAAMAVPLTLLRKLDTLQEHSAQHHTPTGHILRALEPLRELVARHPEWHEELKSGQAPADARFSEPWNRYLTNFGHRGFFESDLARPRFGEQPDVILKSLLSPSPPARSSDSTVLGKLTWPLWAYTRRILDTREIWRDESMKLYQQLREQILRIAKNYPLGEPQRVFALTEAEWRELEHGWVPDQNFWHSREKEISENEAYNVPDLLRRFQPRTDFLGEETPISADGRVYGSPLTKGVVEGTVWLAETAGDDPPENIESMILVVRTVDPGWLFSLPKLAGAIVELGGDLSHGSILLREFGVPAITNAAGATKIFRTGDRVRLVAREGFAEKLQET